MRHEALRWGVLGAASITEATIPAIKRCSGSELVAVASRSRDKAQAWAERYEIPQTCATYEDLLHSGAVDLVYIPLPNSLHAEWTIHALDAGLHVLCEKPIALNADQARAIAEAAARNGKLVAEAFMYRHHPIYAHVREFIAKGGIGTLKSLHAEFSFLLDEPDSIVADATLGGGALMDIGCYCIHAARLITGAEPARVAAFAAMDGVDRSMSGVLEFPGGVLASFSTSIERAERHRLEICGESGTLLLEHPWHPGQTGAGFLLQRHDAPDAFIATAGGDAYHLQAQHFVDAVAGRTALQWGIADAVANMAVIDALVMACQTGRACEVAKV